MNIVIAPAPWGLNLVILAIPPEHGKWFSTHLVSQDTLPWEGLLHRRHTQAAIEAIEGVLSCSMEIRYLRVRTSREVSLESPTAESVMQFLRVLLGGERIPDMVRFWAAEADNGQWLIGQALNVPAITG